MPPPPYNATRLAGLVKAPRPMFADIFNPLALQHKGMDLKRIHVAMDAVPPGKPALLRAFEHAIENGWVEELVGALLTAGALYEDDEPPATSQEGIEFHKITRPLEGLPDAARDSAAAARAQQRVCRIAVKEADGRTSYGTGFLVGPQTVLTNWHVVESLLDGAGKPWPGSAQRLEILFDVFGTIQHKRVLVAEDWLVCWSRTHHSEQPHANNVFTCALAPDGFEDSLDFAVIRLREPEGRARGYYAISSSRVPTVQTPIIVFQHPSGGALVRTSGIATALWPDGVGTRLRHDANTIPGSSGGPVLDSQFELVALHQAGINLGKQGLINAAIPTCYIATKGSSELLNKVEGADPIWRIAATGAPVFGRTEFQKNLWVALTGRHKVLVVRGGPHSGISFSNHILQDRLGVSEHRVLMVSARELPSDAMTLAKLILERAGADAGAIAALPAFTAADTAPDAWLRDILFPEFLNQLLHLAGSRILWLSIDDLEKVHLPTTGATALLQMLLQATILQQGLRVVLLGSDSLAAVIPSEIMSVEDVPAVTAGDIAQTISMRSRQQLGVEPLDATVKAQAAAVCAAAKATAGRVLPEAVRLYRAIVEQAGN